MPPPPPTPCVLIGSEHSLFTGKLKAYLIWRGVPFVELTASADVYRQLILPRTGVAFIPVLVLPDRVTVLQDTHAIIQYFEQQLQHKQHACSSSPQQPYPMPGPLQPASPKLAAASQLLALYGDEWLVLPAMHFRWSFPEQRLRLLYQFGSTNMPTGSYSQQLAAGEKVAARFEGMLPALGITPQSIPTIEARFRWQLAVLQEYFEQHAYLLGSLQPSGADMAFIGPLAAHLFIDPVPSHLIKCSAPLVSDYSERLSGMHSHARVVDRVLQHSINTPAAAGAAWRRVDAAAAAAGAEPQASQAAAGIVAGLRPEDPLAPGEGLLRPLLLQLQQPALCVASSSADVVPRAMLLLLHHMFVEQLPVILSTLELLKAWVQQQHSSSSASSSWLAVPRSLGKHSFCLYEPASGQPVRQPAAGGSGGWQRATSSYVAWRAAEIARWYQQLPAADRAAVLQLLHEVSDVASSSSLPGGRVDAVGAFECMVRLVGECGCIERRSNKVVVLMAQPTPSRL